MCLCVSWLRCIATAGCTDVFVSVDVCSIPVSWSAVALARWLHSASRLEGSSEKALLQGDTARQRNAAGLWFTPRYFCSSASFYQVDLGRLLSHSLSSSSPAVLAASCSHLGWLGSWVVSVLDSGAEGPGFKSQPRRCRVTVLGKLFTPIVPLFTKRRNW